MPDLFVIDALGVAIALDLEGLSVADASAVRCAWSDAAHADPAVRVAEVVRVREPGNDQPLDRLLERLSQRVTLAAITRRRGELWMLHAAGLALPDGRVIALIGPSGRGKTTAARALARALGYVSDETVGITADGQVLPYRKPLSTIERVDAPKVERAPSDLGLRELPDARLRIAAIVLLDRDPEGPQHPIVESVDFGDALEELVAQTSYLAGLDAPLRTVAGIAERVGGIRRVTYRDAETLRDIVADLATAAGPDEPAPAPAAASSAARTPVDARTEAWFRGDVLDAIDLADPDRLAVVRLDESENGTVRVLAGIAPTLWRAAAGASRDDLIRAALAAHGEPEGQDAGALVDGAVTDLVAAGLLEWRTPRWAIRDDVAWTGGPGRYVALALADPAASPLVLEDSAAMVWEALEDPGTITEIAERIAEEAGVSVEVILPSLDGFFAELSAAHLIEAS